MGLTFRSYSSLVTLSFLTREAIAFIFNDPSVHLIDLTVDSSHPRCDQHPACHVSLIVTIVINK